MRRLLLVEDNPIYVRVVEKALERAALGWKLEKATCGPGAIGWLQGQADLSDLLIVLDLRIPGLDGEGVLRILRADPRLSQVPVVILTSSEFAEDRERTLAAGADTYFNKPDSIDGMVLMLHALDRLWPLYRAVHRS